MNDAKKRYKAKVTTVRIELYPTDADIKARLEEKKKAGIPMTTYIKSLIRDDIEIDGYYAALGKERK